MNAPASGWPELTAPPSWTTVDVISDLHLQAQDAVTFQTLTGYLEGTPADALLILGDLFEVWVGDDCLLAPAREDSFAFERQCQTLLARTARHLPIYFMVGNRDFLFSQAALDACGMTALADPTVLVFGQQRWLLSHGDALCLDDADYQRFREQVRAPAWRQSFLGQALEHRTAQARAMRERSELHKRAASTYADVDAKAAVQWLEQGNSKVLIHGHTHRPAQHALGQELQRWVLSDWDGLARSPRAQAMRLSQDPMDTARTVHMRRIDLAPP